MGKKILGLLLLSAVFAGNVFAQEQEEEMAKNRIAISAGIIIGELSYERMLNPHFSVLAQVSYNTLILADSLSVSAKGRWYPFGGAFFIDLGLGYSNGYNVLTEAAQATADLTMIILSLGLWVLSDEFKSHEYNETGRENGFLIQPSMGWNIDVGKKNGFMLPINLGMDIRLANRPTFLPYFKLGLAYSF
jgi:hypothetical protein